MSGRLWRSVTLCLATVALLAGCGLFGEPPGPDDGALPGWARTFVELAERGDAPGLAAHTTREPDVAAAVIADLGPGRGWTVVDVRSAPTGISAMERDVTVRVRDTAGEERTLELFVYWQDGRWRYGGPVGVSDPATLPPGAAEVTPPQG